MHVKNLGIFPKYKSMGMKFKIKNTLRMAANIFLSIMRLNSHTFILGKVYPEYPYTVKAEGTCSKKLTDFLNFYRALRKICATLRMCPISKILFRSHFIRI